MVSMADSGLFALYQLHKVDSALHELRQKAATLDVGREAQRQMQEVARQGQPAMSEAKSLSSELKDLELLQKSLADKSERLNKELYGGSVVNAKEADAIQKEIASIKAQVSRNDDRIMELYELVPASQERAKVFEDRIRELRAVVEERVSAIKSDHEALQTEYQKVGSGRSKLVAQVPASLMSLYDRLREKLGTGMSLITNEQRCSACGVHVAEKSFDQVLHDRVVQCEQCRRILFRLQQT